MNPHSFVIKNYQNQNLIICVEPEAHEVPLEKGEEVVVFDPYITGAAELVVNKSDAGETIISIWPGDGRTRVEKNGVNLLEILPECATV